MITQDEYGVPVLLGANKSDLLLNYQLLMRAKDFKHAMELDK